ncbi:MAG: tRNA (N6-isopentenyl adenosine(37)-C2)-methylthiotransferase MiaB, partial [Firmicutes bacterium]|nr:tRNA (N6-isopentenyl adenosine(37)-C2)-methylthiotransferase MiaB [Bacillota bacterium]
MKPITIKNRPSIGEARSRVAKEVLVIREEVKVPERLLVMASGRHYFIHTYGCQANVRDEETMAGLLEKAGFQKAKTEQDADVIIINTCAVRENAEDKVFGQI